MIIETLRLRNFRNYENLSVSFDPKLNVITGKNAQGKTNLLESIVYLSLTRSHRILNEKKLIRENMPFAEIRCTFSDKDERKELGAVIHPQGKTLIVNRYPVKKSSDFIGLLNVVIFSPDDLYLFNDMPRERRKVMNQEITKISPKYLLSLNRYQNFLKERNSLLKNNRVDDTYLDILDEQMIQEELMIITMRRNFVQKINHQITDLYRELSEDDIEVKIQYKCCIDEAECTPENLQNMYLNCRNRDLENHVSTAGIHREDIIFRINDKELTQTASQGQKRMVMLAFKMALLGYIRSETGKSPVLLMDDVLSELDLNRQKKLLEMVTDSCQCLITATEIPEHMKRVHYKEFYINQGRLEVPGGIE